MQGLSASADHQRPRAVADRKETKGQRWRESRCLQLQCHAAVWWLHSCSLLGPQAEDGERARDRAGVALRGGLHPVLLTLSLSFFGEQIIERGLPGALIGNSAHSETDEK